MKANTQERNLSRKEIYIARTLLAILIVIIVWYKRYEYLRIATDCIGIMQDMTVKALNGYGVLLRWAYTCRLNQLRTIVKGTPFNDYLIMTGKYDLKAIKANIQFFEGLAVKLAAYKFG